MGSRDSEHWLRSCGAPARGIFRSQKSNPCPLHWQVILNHWTTREALMWALTQNYLAGVWRHVSMDPTLIKKCIPALRTERKLIN